jgi:membrane protein insertase Oxa1/YidC/SpoIIIJ
MAPVSPSHKMAPATCHQTTKQARQAQGDKQQQTTFTFSPSLFHFFFFLGDLDS